MWTRRHLVFVVIVFASSLYLLSSNQHVEQVSANLRGLTKHKSSPPSPFDVLETANHDTRISETTLPLGAPAPGFTIFDRLYVRNGTFFAVTQRPEQYPDLIYVLSQGKNKGGPDNIDPTPREMQVITPTQAKDILGEYATVIEGTSIILYDTSQFMAHYYHWWGEIMLGAMRLYSALSFMPGIETPLPVPSRFLLPNVPDMSWRDKAGVNGPLMHAAFPSSSIERSDYWKDLSDIDQAYVFERAMLVSRVAAHKSPLATIWFKMISSTMNVTAAANFWEPLRRRAVQNMIGYLPMMNEAGTVMSPPTSSAPIVIYVSRQGGGRRLRKEDDEDLVNGLKELEREGICELLVAKMETMKFKRQIEAVARSTIMVGVHGNGLTHQIWMPPSARSTVIEIFYPETYLHDYSMLARNMGHKHYAVWNDTTLTYPAGQWFKGVNEGTRDNFHGNSIPVHGKTVADLVRQRLSLDVVSDF
ncbi:unnamed protein product [Cyclocybe aegerita]|uniref:Glycosyltransferase 61 catalytic domain-containing protein n=1 Tax=Cyclocybe aegerita TaxID=1973307 RepID=A0A8S0VZG5_CYCAE|nr:unnamed protein product [Cyclocybe aegerita]